MSNRHFWPLSRPMFSTTIAPSPLTLIHYHQAAFLVPEEEEAALHVNQLRLVDGSDMASKRHGL